MARTSVTDDTVEAVLAGRDDDVPDDLADLATVLRAVRASAERPSAPSADLMDLFAGGAEPQPAPDEAPDPQPVAVGHSWIGAALQRFGALGVVAKLSLVAVLGVAGITGAGAAGALPDGLQDRVAEAVGAVSPFDFPTSEDEAASKVSAPVSEEGTHLDSLDPPGVDGPELADELSPEHVDVRTPPVPVVPAHPDHGPLEAEQTPGEGRTSRDTGDARRGDDAPDQVPGRNGTADDRAHEAPTGEDHAGPYHDPDPDAVR